MDTTHEKYGQGYRSGLTKNDKKLFRENYCGKSSWLGISFTFFNLSLIYGTMGLAYLSFFQLTSPLVLALLTLLSLLVVTRQMRALENIVHFGSHNNFCQDRKLNDLMTNVLAAWPMLQDVKQYRVFHMAHHGDYGSHDDPCKARLEAIGAYGIEINSNRQLILAILRWMPAYVREFYNEVKSSMTQLVTFMAWHTAVAAFFAFTVSWQFAAFVLAIWTVSMFLILPFLRSIAEFSEHDYERGDTVGDTTFNNLGLLDHLLLHPAGDAWHALHHLHPTVTWWKQGAAHRFLMERDQAYRMMHHRDDLIQDLANLPGAAHESGAVSTHDRPRGLDRFTLENA